MLFIIANAATQWNKKEGYNNMLTVWDGQHMQKELKKKKLRWIFFLERKSRMAFFFKAHSWNFPGGSVVESLPSNAGNAGWIPVWELSAHMPWGN